MNLTHQIRRLSIETAASAGVSITDFLPLLEGGLRLRSQHEALSRLFCLNAMAASTYGFGPAKALAWLRQEKLEDTLTHTEHSFLQRGEGLAQQFQLSIEAIWALAWALGVVPELNFWQGCDDQFVTLLPDLRISQTSDEWQRKAKPALRTIDEIVAACDLAYCLHWAIRQAAIVRKQTPGQLIPQVVIERRRALEWLISDVPWDEISLDT